MLELSHLGLAAEKKDSTPFLMGFLYCVATLVGGFMLTQEYLHSLFNYRNGSLFWKIKKSRKTVIGSIAGSKRGCSGYRQIRIDSINYLEHRIIFLFHHGYFPTMIDHINGNPSDNRVENLRGCTYTQNNQNAVIKNNNKCGYKGVYFKKDRKKWAAFIRIKGKKTFLGYFKTAEEAHKTYCEAANKYHNEFANHG